VGDRSVSVARGVIIGCEGAASTGSGAGAGAARAKTGSNVRRMCGVKIILVVVQGFSAKMQGALHPSKLKDVKQPATRISRGTGECDGRSSLHIYLH
jgi:hypothetical protein